MASAKGVEQFREKIGAESYQQLINSVTTTVDCQKRRDALTPAHQALAVEKQFGSRFFRADDGNLYHFDGLTKQLRRIVNFGRANPEFLYYLWDRYRITPTEDTAQVVTSALAAEAYKVGPVPVKRFVSYNRDKNVLYVNKYDGTVWRLDGREITTIDNGSEVFFLNDDQGSNCEADLGPHGLLLDKLVNDISWAQTTPGGQTPEDQKLLFSLWLYAVAFPELLPAKPVLLLVADANSGKTVTMRRIQQTIHGRERISGVSREMSERDWAVSLVREPISLQDNVDSFVPWFPDAVARYVTGGSWVKRKLHTDSDEVVIQPNSFLAVTTRNPVSFYRDDVADRLFILRMQKREFCSVNDDMYRELAELRPKLLGEWLYNLNRIVALLPERPKERMQYRMADFIALGKVTAKVLNFPEEAVAQALAAAQVEREELQIENDVVVEAIMAHYAVFPDFFGSAHPAATWFSALRLTADTAYLNWPFKSARGFLTHVRQKQAALSRKFEIAFQGDNLTLSPKTSQ